MSTFFFPFYNRSFQLAMKAVQCFPFLYMLSAMGKGSDSYTEQNQLESAEYNLLCRQRVYAAAGKCLFA
jgi:hypothetical protein